MFDPNLAQPNQPINRYEEYPGTDGVKLSAKLT